MERSHSERGSHEGPPREQPPKSTRPGAREEEPDDRKEMMEELRAMVRFAQAKGRRVPEDVLALKGKARSDLESEASTTALIRAHDTMASLVQPATARSILVTEVDGRPASLVEIRLLRDMMIACGISVGGFMLIRGLGGSDDSTAPAWAAQLAFLFSAAVGASFFGLFTANRHVAERTFDPSYGPGYWVRFALGVLSGLILANVVTIDSLLGESAGQPGSGTFLSASVIALLGGYSADAVNRILKRMVETLETMVAGRATALVEDQKRAIEERVRAETASRQLEHKADLMAAYSKLADTQVPDELREEFKEILDGLLSE